MGKNWKMDVGKSAAQIPFVDGLYEVFGGGQNEAFGCSMEGEGEFGTVFGRAQN
jgi:hypothetical protein